MNDKEMYKKNLRKNQTVETEREKEVYRYHANEFVGELPEWNDGKLCVNETEQEISIQEVREKVEIYNDGGFQVFCNFNFEGRPKRQVRLRESFLLFMSYICTA